MKWFGSRERYCCGCSVTLGSQILATVSAIFTLCSLFTIFFSGDNWILIMAKIIYCFSSLCASGLVFQAIRTGRAILMAPQMLVAIINAVALLIGLIVCLFTAFGAHTSINDKIELWYTDYDWMRDIVDKYADTPTAAEQAYAQSYAWYWSICVFLLLIFALWVFMVHFDCFRTIKAGEGYPTAQYHGHDNITVPIYPTYPVPVYDAAVAAATANQAPAYSGPANNTPYSFTNPCVTTADETPVKVPLP